jgi:hypothetical protein
MITAKKACKQATHRIAHSEEAAEAAAARVAGAEEGVRRGAHVLAVHPLMAWMLACYRPMVV